MEWNRKRFGIETYVLALRAAGGDEYKADELLDSIYEKTTDFIWVIMEDDEIIDYYHSIDKFPYFKRFYNEPEWLTDAIHDEVNAMDGRGDYVYVDGFGEEIGYP